LEDLAPKSDSLLLKYNPKTIFYFGENVHQACERDQGEEGQLRHRLLNHENFLLYCQDMTL
jgi:hypothetical protein